MEETHIFIANPTSGKGKSLIIAKLIDEYCKLKKVNYKIIYTKFKGEASRIANYFSKNPLNKIYSVGGDGTLNEVINGLNENSKFCIIPSGSGNDFYKSIEFKDSDKIDIGEVNGRKFINIASIGLDANVADRANKLKKYKLPSNTIYVLGLLSEFNKYSGNTITINGKKTNNNILAICNGRFYGGGFNIGPKANISDGLFDICEVEYKSKLDTIKLIPSLLKAKHFLRKEVKYYNFGKNEKELVVTSNYEIPCNVDGEIIYNKNFVFKMLDSKIYLENDKLELNNFLKTKKLIK